MNVKVSQSRIDDFFRPQLTIQGVSKVTTLAQASKRTAAAIDKVLANTKERKPKVTSGSTKAKKGKSNPEDKSSATQHDKRDRDEANKANKAKEARERAAIIYKKSLQAKKKSSKKAQPPKRIVLDKHNLSESDSDWMCKILWVNGEAIKESLSIKDFSKSLNRIKALREYVVCYLPDNVMVNLRVGLINYVKNDPLGELNELY